MNDRIPAIDYWRHIAASAVVFSHSYVLSGVASEEPLHRLTGRIDAAEVAVDFFFCLSGFLMYGALRRDTNLLGFFSSRFARLLPGLVVCVMLTTLVLGVFATAIGPLSYISAEGTRRYILNAAFYFVPTLPGVFSDNPYPSVVNGSLWTLTYEVICYFGVAATAAFGTRGRTSASLMVATGCLVFLAVDGMPEPNRYANLARLAFFFFVGVATACSWRTTSWIVAALSSVVVVGLFQPSLADRVPTNAALAMTCIACLLAAHRIGDRLPLLPFDFSFGIYIYAFPVQQCLAQWFAGTRPLPFFMVSMLLTIPLAALSWHLIEKPALRKIRRWYKISRLHDHVRAA